MTDSETKIMKVALLSSILLGFLVKQTKGCGGCSTTSDFSCYNQISYQSCYSGIPMGPLLSCPPGRVCVDGSCELPSAFVTADCAEECIGSCDVVSPLFICTGPVTYKMCLGSREVDGICPTGQVCNNLVIPGEDFPCIDLSSVFLPLCCSPTINVTGLFPITQNEADLFCGAIGKHGLRYPTLIEDTKCKTYYYCYLYGGRMRGQQYTCPGRTVFDCKTRACVAPTNPLPDCTFCNSTCLE